MSIKLIHKVKHKLLTHSIVLFCLLTGFALMAYVNVERQKLENVEQVNVLDTKAKPKCKKTQRT
jgi:hypothetical protein